MKKFSKVVKKLTEWNYKVSSDYGGNHYSSKNAVSAVYEKRYTIPNKTGTIILVISFNEQRILDYFVDIVGVFRDTKSIEMILTTYNLLQKHINELTKIYEED